MSLYQLQLNIESDSINHVSNLGKCICALICSGENVLVKSYGATKREPNSENVEPKTQTASLKQHTHEAISAIEGALRIKDLWAPNGDYENESEGVALNKMLRSFESVMQKLHHA